MAGALPPGGGADGAPFGDVLRFFLNSFPATLGTLAGLGPDWARVLAAAATAGIVVWALRRRHIEARVLAMLALPLIAWGVTALARTGASSPYEGRYMLPNALFLLLAAGHVLPRWTPGPRSGAVVLIALAGAVATNGRTAFQLADGRRITDASTKLNLGALVLARPSALSTHRLTPVNVYGNFTVPRYFAALDRYGPMEVNTQEQIARGAADVRARADAELLAATGFGFRPAEAAGGQAPVVQAAGVQPQVRGACTTVPPAPGGGAITTTLPAAGVLVRPAAGDAVVERARVWADGFPAAGATTTTAALLRPPRTAVVAPWRVQLTHIAALTLCGLA